MSENKSVGFILMNLWAQTTTAEERDLGALLINTHSYPKMLQMLEYNTQPKNQHQGSHDSP